MSSGGELDSAPIASTGAAGNGRVGSLVLGAVVVAVVVVNPLWVECLISVDAEECLVVVVDVLRSFVGIRY
jgi:hypothetical protein